MLWKKKKNWKISIKFLESEFRFLKDCTCCNVCVTKEEPERGLFFKIVDIKGKNVLFPVLSLLERDIHESLIKHSGAIVSEGNNADLVLDMSGFLHISSDVHAQGRGYAVGRNGTFEVKNYTIGKNTANNNISNLVRDVSRQIKQRNVHLPEGMKQYIKIDVRGQGVDDQVKAIVRQKIVEKSNGLVRLSDIGFM